MAQRPATPFDLKGTAASPATGVQWFRGKANVETGTPANGVTPVNKITAAVKSGTPDSAASQRDDYRPNLGTLNGGQAIAFDGGTRQLPMSTNNLPAGSGDKWWLFYGLIEEPRSGDYYPLGYGGGSGTGVAYKMRQGSLPTVDIGNDGFNVGDTFITDIAILLHTYKQSGQKSQGWFNAQSQPTVFTGRALNTSASNARLGSWPQYGGYTKHKFGGYITGYGELTADDVALARAIASWDMGDNGANLPADSPWKNIAPTVDDGTGGASASGGTSLGDVAVSAAAALTIAAAAALTIAPILGAGMGGGAIRGTASPSLPPVIGAGSGRVATVGGSAVNLSAVTSAGAGSASVGAAGSPVLDAIQAGGSASNTPIVGAQGSASLGAVSAGGAAGVSIAAGGSTIVSGFSSGGNARPVVQAAGAAAAGMVGTAGGAGATIVARASTSLAARSSGRGGATVGGGGTTLLPPVLGAGNGSPPTPPIIVPDGRRFVLASIGSRRTSLTSSGSRRLTI